MSKKYFVWFAMVIALCLLAGCSGNGVEPSVPGSNGQKEEAGVPPVNTDPVEITFYGIDREEEFEMYMGSYIKKKFPYITLKFITPRSQGEGVNIDKLILSGVNVDLYKESIGGFFSSLPKHNLQYDLTPLIEQNRFDLNVFEPTLIDSLKNNADGQIWGLPVSTTAMSLYYNQDMFNRSGVPYLKDGITWDELFEVAKRFNRVEDGKLVSGLAISPSHSIKMNNYSLPFYNQTTGKSTYSDDRWKQVLRPLLEPAKDTEYQRKIAELSNKLPYSTEFIKNQELAIFGVFANWQIKAAQPAPFEWDLAAYPTFNELPGAGSQQYPTFVSIPNFAKNKQKAFEILTFLTSEEYQSEMSRLGDMTVLKSDSVKKLFGSGSVYKNKNFGAVYYNEFAPIMTKSPYDAVIEKAITDQLVNIAMNQQDINSALRTAQEVADKAIEAEKAK